MEESRMIERLRMRDTGQKNTPQFQEDIVECASYIADENILEAFSDQYRSDSRLLLEMLPKTPKNIVSCNKKRIVLINEFTVEDLNIINLVNDSIR